MSPHERSEPGFDDLTFFDMPAPPGSVRETAPRRRLTHTAGGTRFG